LAQRLNQCVQSAHGRYIARMDADDIAYPDRLARQVAFLQAHPDIDLAGTRALAFRSDGSIIGLPPFRERHEEITAKPWGPIPLPHPTWMGRADWFRQHPYRLPEVKLGEDQDLLLSTYEHSRFACLPEVLLGYRQGQFSPRKTMRARYHLARAHVREHWAHGRYAAALRAPALAIAKSAVDLLAGMPGMQSIFFARMAYPPDEGQIQMWNQLWRKLHSSPCSKVQQHSVDHANASGE
jgi:glycosyltransferase involved in cell wall biosynthesis